MRRFVISRQNILPCLIALGFVVAATSIILYGDAPIPYRQGEVLQQAVPVRVDFAYEDHAETRRIRAMVQQNAAAVYVLNAALLQQVESELLELQTSLRSQSDPDKQLEALTQRGWQLDAAAVEILRKYADDSGSEKFEGLLQRVRQALLQQNLVARTERGSSRPTADLRLPTKPGEPPVSRPVATTTLNYVSNDEHVKEATRRAAAPFLPPLQNAIAAKIESIMRPASGEPPQPIYRYNDELTQAEAEQAASAVQLVVRTYTAGGTLIPVGAELKPEHLDLIRAEQAAFRARAAVDPVLRAEQQLSQAGVVLLVVLVSLCLFVFTAIDQPRIVHNKVRALTAAALLLVMLGAARITFLVDFPRELAVAGVVTTASILTLAYTRRFAVGTMLVISALMALGMARSDQGSSDLLILLVIAGLVSVVFLTEVRTRTKLIEMGALAGLAAFLTRLGAGLNGSDVPDEVFRQSGLAGVSALGAGFFLQGILPLIERAFRITTSLTLLEWCDANRPLLKRMAQEAPGTYNHSLVISSLAEAAADAIGLDGLLLRVGALYHDIGKMNKPEYFTENQQAHINRHDSLSPTISHLIIVGHVKDGIEMAKEYGLPTVLHQFIAEHHGTTVVRYFHHIASEQKGRTTTGKHDREVSDTEFRYPGPKPQSKATAILMLCDSVEGAARAMPEPTAGRIESLVHQITMERLRDGQLDQCDITLRELRLIEDSLAKSLCRFYHSRIAYPQKSGAEASTRRGAG